MILDDVIRKPISWMHRQIATLILKKKVGDAKLKTVDTSFILKAIQSAYSRSINIVLTDAQYVVPTVDIIKYIQENLWMPYKTEKGISYTSTMDCDNFAGSFYNLVQELNLGLCIGMAHYSWYKEVDGVKKYVAHAVACFVDPNGIFWLIEPQTNGYSIYELPKDNDLNFVYLEGVEVL